VIGLNPQQPPIGQRDQPVGIIQALVEVDFKPSQKSLAGFQLRFQVGLPVVGKAFPGVRGVVQGAVTPD
jgi:hypothetical protein